jgi:serine/threonine protein kinase
MRTRPAAPAAPPPAAAAPPAPQASPIPPRPVPPRKPEPAGGDDDIDAILSRTLGNLDSAPRRPAAPAQPPRPAAPPTEGTAVRRPASAMDQLAELTRTMRSPAPAAPQSPRPAAPPAPAQPAPAAPILAPLPVPVPVPEPEPPAPVLPPVEMRPEPEPLIEWEPELELELEPASEPLEEMAAPVTGFPEIEPLPEIRPLEIDPPSSSSPFGSDPFDLSALELPPPVEEPEPAPPAEIVQEEPVFELEMEPEADIEAEPEPVPEPLQESQPGTVYEPLPFPTAAGMRGADRADRADIATTQRIPVTLDDTLDIPGAERFGQYTLLEKIAAGGMAEVWKARMRGVEGFQKTVAIKKILPHMTDNSEFIGMFIDEAKLAAQLSHPNIVHIYDLGKISRDYYIAMEYVEGKDLRSILNAARRKGQPLPLGLALLITSRVASALDYAHRKRDFEGNDLALVHRDVSPQNVLITFEGDVKLCDFGIAKAVSKAGQTQMGALKGKLQYMSPEQAWGRAVDARSDIFSLGAVLFEMITGERLFSGDTEMSILEAVRQGRIRTPRDIDPTVPPAVDEIVARALAYEVRDRFQSAGEMMQRIEVVLHETPPSPGPSDLAAFLDRVLAPEPSSDAMFMPPMPRFPQSVHPVPQASPAPGIPAPSAHAQIAPSSPVDLPESLFAPSPASPATEAMPVEAVAPVGDVHMEEPGGRKSRLFLVIAIVVVVLLGVLVTFFLLNRRGGDPPADSSATSPGATYQPSAPAPASAPGSGTLPAAAPVQAQPQPAAQPEQKVDYEAILQEEIEKGMREKEAELRRKYEKKLKEEMARAEKAAKPPAEPPASEGTGAETAPPPR